MPQRDPVSELRRIALSHPDVVFGTTCDKFAFRSGGKAFLFVGSDGPTCDVKVKLLDSLPEAQRLADEQPGAFKVGVHGWVTLVFPVENPPPRELLERWVAESRRLLVAAPQP